MISCGEAAELLSAQLDGALDPSGQAELEEHLAQCPSCRALQADFQAIHSALLDAAAHWTAEPPEDLTRKVMDRVRAGTADSASKRTRRPVWRRWASLAALLALVILGGSAAGLWRVSTSGGASGSGAGEATAEAAVLMQEPDAPAGDAAPAPQDAPLVPRAANGNPEQGQPSGLSADGCDVNGQTAYHSSALEGAYLALELAYAELGGDTAWQRAPLEDPETVGYALTPAGEQAKEQAVLILVAEPAGEEEVYQFSYYSGAADLPEDRTQTEECAFITVDLAQNAVSWSCQAAAEGTQID